VNDFTNDTIFDMTLFFAMSNILTKLFSDKNLVRKIQNNLKPGINSIDAEISRKEIRYDPYKRWVKYWEED